MLLFYISMFILVCSRSLLATPHCPQGHCSKISSQLNTFCIENGMSGKPYMVFGPDGSPCLCPCSCVTPDTYLESIVSETLISQAKVGDKALTPMAEEEEGRIERKLRSRIKNASLYKLAFSNGAQLKVSDNHTFITSNETTTTAAELKKGDEVLDRDLQIIQVLESRKIPHYSGVLVNVITNAKSMRPYDHVLSTNGVLSGDWLLQAHSDAIETGVAIRADTLALEFLHAE